MPREEIQDSDEEASDESSGDVARPSAQPRKGSFGLPASANTVSTSATDDSDQNKGKRKVKLYMDATSASDDHVMPTVEVLSDQPSHASDEVLLADKLSFESHDSKLQPNTTSDSFESALHKSFEVSSQKRLAYDIQADKDEVSLIPNRKRQRVDPMKAEKSSTLMVLERVSMPPPGSQDSVYQIYGPDSQIQSANSSVRLQPSPPRMVDNLSFTTTGSTGFRHSRSASLQMFPPLDNVQQQGVDMEVDQITDIDSYPASQHNDRDLNDKKIEQDMDLENLLTTDGLATHSQVLPSKSTQYYSHKAGDKPRPSTLIRVEVPEYDGISHKAPTDCSVVEGAPSKRKRGRPRKKNEYQEEIFLNSQKEPEGAGDLTLTAGFDVKSGSNMSKGENFEPVSSDADADVSSTKTIDDRSWSSDASRKLPSNDLQKLPTTSTPPRRDKADKQFYEMDSDELPPQTPGDDVGNTSPKKHSPLSNGSVPLRVGLSKRVRIEPLLKVVRK